MNNFENRPYPNKKIPTDFLQNHQKFFPKRKTTLFDGFFRKVLVGLVLVGSAFFSHKAHAASTSGHKQKLLGDEASTSQAMVPARVDSPSRPSRSPFKQYRSVVVSGSSGLGMSSPLSLSPEKRQSQVLGERKIDRSRPNPIFAVKTRVRADSMEPDDGKRYRQCWEILSQDKLFLHHAKKSFHLNCDFQDQFSRTLDPPRTFMLGNWNGLYAYVLENQETSPENLQKNLGNVLTKIKRENSFFARIFKKLRAKETVNFLDLTQQFSSSQAVTSNEFSKTDFDARFETFKATFSENQNALFDQIYAEADNRALNLKDLEFKKIILSDPTKWFRFHNVSDSQYLLPPHFQTYANLLDHLSREWKEESGMISKKFPFFSPQDDLIYSNPTILEPTETLSEFIDNKRGVTESIKRQWKINLAEFLLTYAKDEKIIDLAGDTPHVLGAIAKKYRHQEQTLLKEKQSLLPPEEQAPEEHELIKTQVRDEILQTIIDNELFDATISRRLFLVIKARQTQLRIEGEDILKVSHYLHNHKTLATKISETLCKQLQALVKKQNPSYTKAQVEQIKRITALGSPGILMELGELQAYNLLAFEKFMVDFAKKSNLAKKFNYITWVNDENAVIGCATELAIEQINTLNRLKLDVLEIKST